MRHRIDFPTFYRALSDQEKDEFARKADTSRGYIESHLLAPYKIPRADAMKRLADASGCFTVGQLATWFYEATLAREARAA